MDMNDLCNAPMWFLTSYATALGVYCVANTLIKHCNKKHVVLTGIIVVHMLCSCLPILLPWSIDTAFAGAIFMFAGKEIKEHGFIVKKKSIILLAIGFMIIAEFNGVTNMATRLWGRYDIISSILFITTGISGSLLLLFACYKTKNLKFCKIFSLIGKNTLLLLAFHLVIYKLLPVINIEEAKVAFYFYSLCEVVITTFVIVSISEFSKRYTVKNNPINC